MSDSKPRIITNEAVLRADERAAIAGVSWFAWLSPDLRRDIFRNGRVRRLSDEDPVCVQCQPAREWIAVARGLVRIRMTANTGKRLTLCYVEPGAWFGEDSIFSDGRYAYDAHAVGETTIFTVSAADLLQLLTQHAEFYPALIRLQVNRIRQLNSLIEDLKTLPLAGRVARQLARLCRQFGSPSANNCSKGTPIDVGLAQSELAHLLGSSRQRVNQELKRLERLGVIRIRTGGLVVHDAAGLFQICESTLDRTVEQLSAPSQDMTLTT